MFFFSGGGYEEIGVWDEGRVATAMLFPVGGCWRPSSNRSGGRRVLSSLLLLFALMFTGLKPAERVGGREGGIEHLIIADTSPGECQLLR